MQKKQEKHTMVIAGCGHEHEVLSEPDIIREMGAFAAESLGEESGFKAGDGFPMDLWRSMGEAGFMGLTLPAEYGGRGLPFTALALGAEAMVGKGANLGVVLAWIIHCLVSDFYISRFAQPGIRDELLPGLASGKITAAVAVSEPGVGANPKYLTTLAISTGDGFSLSGTKMPVTNGPLAHVFVVIAVTGNSNGKNNFSAFLVPRTATGLTVGPALELPILKPSLHCSIGLDNARIDTDHVLGDPDTAFETMVRPFRRCEQGLLSAVLDRARVLAAMSQGSGTGFARDMEAIAGLVEPSPA
ncbi:MAG: acyl-CoA dehydrogenase family protein [Pseudomonadota bacterium]